LAATAGSAQHAETQQGAPGRQQSAFIEATSAGLTEQQLCLAGAGVDTAAPPSAAQHSSHTAQQSAQFVAQSGHGVAQPLGCTREASTCASGLAVEPHSWVEHREYALPPAAIRLAAMIAKTFMTVLRLFVKS
jgi:hypothetical protein